VWKREGAHTQKKEDRVRKRKEKKKGVYCKSKGDTRKNIPEKGGKQKKNYLIG